MHKVLGRVVLLALTLRTASGSASEPALPADFKVVITYFGVQPAPIARAELVAKGGRAYLFDSESPEEVVVFDPSIDRLVLIDMKRRIQTEITQRQLDATQARLHKAIADSIARREQSGGRAGKVAAAMSRDLIDPKFTESFDATAHRLRLTNPTVEAMATGEADADSARQSLVSSTLAAITKLAASRNPKAIPPFPRLDVFKALAARKLRPTEVSFLYRLAGPPQKQRWTYSLVSNLTEREVEALGRIEMLRGRAAFVRLERYEEAASAEPSVPK